MANNTPVTRDDIAKLLAPFFSAELLFRQDSAAKAGAYNCAICHDDVGDKGQYYAISYNVSKYGTWAHPNCVKMLGFTVSLDDKAKQAAKKAAQADTTARLAAKKALDAQNVAKAALVATPPPAPTPCEPTISLDTFEAELRSKIEGEYDALFDQAIARFDAMTRTIANLEEALRLSKADYSVMYDKATALHQELAMVKSVAVYAPTNADTLPAPTTTSTVGRCGEPKYSDGLPCKWNVAKSPCPHHTVATAAPVSQTTVNARQNDSALTDEEKRAARAQKRADRQARLGKVA